MKDDDSVWVDCGGGIMLKISRYQPTYPPILDWDGVKDKNGNEIPYSPEKAIEILDENEYFAAFVYSLNGTDYYKRLFNNIEQLGC